MIQAVCVKNRLLYEVMGRFWQPDDRSETRADAAALLSFCLNSSTVESRSLQDS